MDKAVMTKRCPYCQDTAEVVNISVREIPGYHNPITGKNTAIVERLSCSHEYVDGRFNVSSIYFTNPTPNSLPPMPSQKIELKVIPQQQYESKRSHGLRFMDLLCMVCLVVLAFTIPILVVLPLTYFICRLSTQ